MGYAQRWAHWVHQDHPSDYLEGLAATGDLQRECPGLAALIGVQQEAEWHPEGDAFSHTLCVVDAMADLCVRDRIQGEDRPLYLLAALCHDFGKASTTKWNDAKRRWTAYGHDVAGVEPTLIWLKTFPWVGDKLAGQIAALVRLHMVHARPANQATKKSVRRILEELGEAQLFWVDLYRICEADLAGRPPLSGEPSETLLCLNTHVAELNPSEAVDLANRRLLVCNRSKAA